MQSVASRAPVERARPSRPARALRALAALRRRVRAFFFLDGVVALGLAVCAFVIGSFLVDYALKLPRGVRVVLLAAALAGLVAVLVRRLLRPRRIRLPLEDLAALVEEENPQLKQSLITAVQLTRPDSESARYVSAELIASVVEDVERNLPRISMARVLKLGRLARAAVLLAVLIVLLGAAAASRADLAAIWFDRVCLVGSADWPKRVALELVEPSGEEVTIALGEDLPVVVRVVRGDPGEVEILRRDLDPGEGRDGGPRSDFMSPTPDGSFRKVYLAVSRSFSFEVRAGDDRIGPIDVTVKIRPKIAGVRLWLRYPEYAGKPPTPPQEPLLDRRLEAEVGTEVTFEAETNLAVSHAYFRFVSATALAEAAARARKEGRDPALALAGDGGWPPSGPGDLVELEVEPLPPAGHDGAAGGGGDGSSAAASPFPRSRLRGTFTVAESGHYMFHLLAENGLHNLKPVRFEVKALPDRPPVVRIVEPVVASQEVSPEARVAVRLVARDDHGLRGGRLAGVLFDEQDARGKSFEMDLDELASAAPREAKEGPVEAERTIDVAALGARPGDRVQYRAEATDHGGNTGQTGPYSLHIAAKEEILRLLQTRLMLVRDQITRIEGEQGSARKDLEDFQRAVALKQQIGTEEAGKLTRHRRNQQEVTRSIGRAAKEMASILDRMESNKVGEEKDIGWLREVAAELASIGENESKAVEDEIQELRAKASETPQKIDRLPPIVEEQKEIERDLRDVALRLSDYGDLTSVIQRWRQILKKQIEIRDEVIRNLREESGTQ